MIPNIAFISCLLEYFHVALTIVDDAEEDSNAQIFVMHNIFQIIRLLSFIIVNIDSFSEDDEKDIDICKIIRYFQHYRWSKLLIYNI